MIGEVVVLSRIQYLEERARRIALERHAELVNLVEQEDGILRPGLLHSLDDASWHGPHVRAPVATNVSLVTSAPRATRTYSRPNERAIDFAIDVLPTPGGPTKSRIGPLAMARDFASFGSVIVRSSSDVISCGVASSFAAFIFATGSSPVFVISSASCCARS